MTNPSRVVLTGTWNRPQLQVYFNPHQEHPAAPEKTLSVWMEEYMLGTQRGQGYWTGRLGCWTLNATGANAERKFALAGFDIDYSETAGTDLAAVMNLDELVTPITRLSPDGKSALILARLFGYENTKDALGYGARWDREFKRFQMPVSDAMHKGSPRPDIHWEPNILEAARLALGRVITDESIATAVAAAGSAKDVLEMDARDVEKLIGQVGDIPDWFGLDLFPFQRIGAIAVAAGHFGLFDEPGLGKTRQTIAAASILGSERTLITCLPVGLTGWKNEVEQSLLHTLGGKNPDGQVIIIRAGKKEPETLPDKGVIITSDSLLTSRPELLKRILEWQPDVFGYDEAHRGKTFESARSQAMLKISAATKKAPIPITGTPLFANPSELAPLLEFSGHLGPVFGGLNAYLDRYCKPGHFGGWMVRKENLGELRLKLAANVWVRRRKRDVLPDLPKTLLVPKYVDVPLTEYKRAHKDVLLKLTKWVEEFRKLNDGRDPEEEEVRDYAVSQVGLVSLLRRAAGVAKVPALVADIQTHVEDTTEWVNGQRVFTRPLIVWAHHRDVTDALAAALPAAVAETGIIRGGVAHAERDRLVSEFQAHRIPVLVCSIAAAGVAITLTASSDSFFAESDWTPATVRQALDRAERIGQTSDKLISTTYLAEGTLDLRIQQILKEKSKVLDAIYGDGNDVSVDGMRSDVESSTDLLVAAINLILAGKAADL
jgi:hypothetical protein